ncbi:MAG: DUF4157 domain-containing protein [Desulfobacteraceae bacterium]|nr:DUF4157 domain-containing protein [Desulfobacteraceae bacterium]
MKAGKPRQGSAYRKIPDTILKRVGNETMVALEKKQNPDKAVSKSRTGTRQSSVPGTKGFFATSPCTGAELLQCKPICPCAGGCPRCEPVVQAKPMVGRLDDKYELEADRVADRVMGMPESRIQAKTACPCGDEEVKGDLIQTKPEQGETPQSRAVSEAQTHPRYCPGTPLSPSSRRFFEPRFGQDFSDVRVHTCDSAVEISRGLNAQALTYKNNIYFNRNKYAPETSSGKRLLAHELTHVVQQQGRNSESSPQSCPFANDSPSRVKDMVQRACGPDEIGEPAGCTFDDREVTRPRYLFVVDCDRFRPGNEDDLRRDARRIRQGDVVELHGIASIEGSPDYNLHLSCARALKAGTVVEDVLRRRGVSATIRVFNHGGIRGNREFQRSVVMNIRRAAPVQPPEPARRCGPDATDWLIRQVAAAKRDPAVLAVQADLAGANRIASRYGFSADRIAEGAVVRRVLTAESALATAGTPATRTPGFRRQLAASVPGQRAFGRAVVASSVPLAGAPEAIVLAGVRRAALSWRNLVGTGRRFDFKNDPRTMQRPTSAHCPDDCANTITLCPGTGSDCFRTDVPGNLFFAHVGRFVGWTELALQLGSQFAQLRSAGRFDTLDDTRMIRLGCGLPDPLTRTALCAAINASRSIFVLRPCGNCTEATTARVV